jgi:hypothetical protein
MEQKKPKRRSISEKLRYSQTPEHTEQLMAQWSANITARTDETLNLAYNAHLANDTEALGEYLRDLSRFIRQSMSAVPNITRILQGQAKSKEGE